MPPTTPDTEIDDHQLVVDTAAMWRSFHDRYGGPDHQLAQLEHLASRLNTTAPTIVVADVHVVAHCARAGRRNSFRLLGSEALIGRLEQLAVKLAARLPVLDNQNHTDLDALTLLAADEDPATAQPRERAVPCFTCGQPTWHLAGYCTSHYSPPARALLVTPEHLRGDD